MKHPTDDSLKPCPFCGAGTTKITPNGRMWTGMKYSEPSSVSVRHWCDSVPGQPSRMLERVGRDEASAIEAWNARALLAAQPAGAWLPTAENINALPEPLRDYVHQLEARCDPSGTVRENAQLKDVNKGLQIMYRNAADAAAQPAGAWMRIPYSMPPLGEQALVWCKFGPHWSPMVDCWDEQHEAPVSFSSATIPVGPGWDPGSEFEDVTHWMRIGAPEQAAAQPAVQQPAEDAELLDWIFRQGDEFSYYVIQDAPGDGEYVVHGMGCSGQGKTPRAAIRAARAAERKA